MAKSARIVTFKANEFKRDGSPVADNAAKLTGRIDIPVEMLDEIFAELKAQQHREYNGKHYATLRVSLFDDPKGKRVHSGPVEVMRPYASTEEQQELPLAEAPKPVKRTNKADAVPQ